MLVSKKEQVHARDYVFFGAAHRFWVKFAERVKKRVHRQNEKGTNDTKVPLQGVISPHMHESCPLADIISRSIFQLFHIHEGFKTIPRNDTKTIPISDPFCVSKTMTHVYRVHHGPKQRREAWLLTLFSLIA